MTALANSEERHCSASLTDLLQEVGGRLGDRVVLWRGPDLRGSDVDLLAATGAQPELADLLEAHGLRPSPGDPGHVVWRGAGLPPIDVFSAAAWPPFYPSLEGLLGRLQRNGALPPSASAADRALISAGEAVAGRPLDKVRRRAGPAVREAGAELAATARAEDLEELAQLIRRPDELAALARRGRLSYPRAARLAWRSSAARAALLARTRGRVRDLADRLPGMAPSPPGPRPLLVALSGMDGAGKSTAAEALQTQLQAYGLPVEVAWARLGAERQVLDAIALPVKRVLRRQGTVADPVAVGPLAAGKVRDPREDRGRRPLVSWVWIAIVALANARSYRRAAGEHRRRGVTLVCDRWATDALVDLELRYGRHRLARAILRRLPPRPDLQVVLELDASTAAARKPGDQAEPVLAEMERLYETEAAAVGARRIDARLPPEQVGRALAELVDALEPG